MMVNAKETTVIIPKVELYKSSINCITNHLTKKKEGKVIYLYLFLDIHTVEAIINAVITTAGI